MPKKPKSNQLLEKSVQAVISAIEIYNKPDFKYREESFTILMVNAWETLLKAKIIKDNANRLQSVYVTDESARTKAGTKYKFPKYRINRAGNFMTIDIFNALKRLNLNERLRSNIELLVEIRDNSIHFFNDSKLFEKKVLEVGTATLKSYVQCVTEWFNYDLSKYNFYLMPISFFHPYEMESFSINAEDKQHQNLLNFIAQYEHTYPSDEEQIHNISLRLETKFVRSSSMDGFSFRYDNEDPHAINIKLTEDESYVRNFPWSYKEDLIPRIKNRYVDFKHNQSFNNLMKKLEQNNQLCKRRYLDVVNKKGTARKYYSTNILKELDKHYTRKNTNG